VRAVSRQENRSASDLKDSKDCKDLKDTMDKRVAAFLSLQSLLSLRSLLQLSAAQVPRSMPKLNHPHESVSYACGGGFL
jgi:hypothetical protein